MPPCKEKSQFKKLHKKLFSLFEIQKISDFPIPAPCDKMMMMVSKEVETQTSQEIFVHIKFPNIYKEIKQEQVQFKYLVYAELKR